MSTYQYPSFKIDDNGAIMCVQDTGSSTPTNLGYQYPPFLVNENGAILMAEGS